MELGKAQLDYMKYDLGKCFDCSHRSSYNYCLVRRELMFNNLMGHLFTIAFCKYYEKRK